MATERAYTQAWKCLSTFMILCLLASNFSQVPIVKAQTTAAENEGMGSESAHLPALLGICPPAISFGETIQCSIATPGETDSYTFTASAGDTVLVRMSKTPGDLWPAVNVMSGATQICQVYSSTTAEIASCSLPGTGTYTLLAYDYFGSNTGEYYLHLQRLNDPGSAVPISFGQTLPGSIATPAEMDSYTFTASAGDTVLVRMSKATGNIWPGIRVMSGATQVCDAYGSTTAEIASCSLPGTGTYTLLAYDHFGSGLGDYHLHLQRLNNPGGAVPISFGQTLPGSIATPAEMDSHTFTAEDGDTVMVTMTRTSGNIWPGVRIHGPDGVKRCETYASSMARIAGCILSGAGLYTILAYDYFGTGSGGYSLTLQEDNPANATPLTLGVPLEITASMDLPGWYQVDIPAGAQNLFFTLQKSGWWSGELKLYNGTQLLLTSSSSSDQILQWPSPTPGTYRLQVNGSGSGKLTAYTALPNLPLGQWVVGSIYRSWGSAWYQLIVPAGQGALHLRVETLGLWSQLKVFRGALDGPQVGQATGPSMSLDLASPPPGVYYVQLTDSAWIDGADQTRDHIIRADANPIEPPPCTEPVISSFTPDTGGTAGQVTISIEGQCLDALANVQLVRTGFTSISPASVVGNDDRHSLTATFHLIGVEPGNWDIVITNPNHQTVTAQTLFKVKSGGEAKLWITISGREVVRSGQQQTIYIEYGNSGDIDAEGTPLWIDGIPNDIDWELDVDIKPAQQQPGLEPIDWSQVPTYIEKNGVITVPLLIPVIPPGYKGEIPVKVTIPSNRKIQIQASINPAGAFCSPSSPAEECISGILKFALGGIPGLSCAMDFLCMAYNQSHSNAKPGEVQSLFFDLVNTLISCAKDLSFIGEIIDAVYSALSAGVTQMNCFAAAIKWGLEMEAVSSISPEDKYGPAGYDASGINIGQFKHWIPSEQKINYRIDFWNKENAPAATVDVIITDTLDPDLDWNTFKFTEVGFLDWKVPLEPTQHFNVDIPNVVIDLSKYYPGQPVVTMTVNVEGTFDPGTGEIRWAFHALDPATRQPPENPYAGFLPPITNTGWEMGWVNFSADPKPGLPSGTVISNQSFVKFDLDVFKPAPAQGPFINTLDAVPPASAVLSPTGTQTCDLFFLSLSGVDDLNGSGLQGFDVYVDDLADPAPAYLWQANIADHSPAFTGIPGHAYGFYTRARDNTGNLEATPQPLAYDVEVTAGPQILGCNLDPRTASIKAVGNKVTNAASVSYSVNFSEPVSGVDQGDFTLTGLNAAGASISSVTDHGDGISYTVIAATGPENGSLHLEVIDNNSIVDGEANALGGPDPGDGNFTAGESYTVLKNQTFSDVSITHAYRTDIEILYANHLTAGCQLSPLKFCPDKIMNRAEAAAFNLRAHFGPSYVPPAATHIFVDDWTKGPWGEPWAEGMKLNGYSAGCQVNPPKYCPWNQIPREQAVIFALKIKYGKDYTPPPATGTLFADMTNTAFYATAWAEQAYIEGLIPNCGMSGGKPKFCPKTLVSRGLAAYMIVRAKNLTMP